MGGRLDNFTDAAFAFAVTLLIIGGGSIIGDSDALLTALGDLPAFRLVEQLRREGRGGLLVCSASHEEDALSRIADVVVQGPSGVATWLEELADALESRRDAPQA